MRRHFISIEVSGTDSPTVKVPPGDILLRPGKLLKAEEDGVECFFYMVYPTSIWVVTLSTAKAHRRNVTAIQRKGRYETYIAVPATAALPPSSLFDSISMLLHTFEPRISLEETRR